MAERIAPAFAHALGERVQLQVLPCRSQIGSASLPVDRLPSVCLALGPTAGTEHAGLWPERLAEALRGLPIPVIGRIEYEQIRLDLRGLDDREAEQALVAQLPRLIRAEA